MRPRARLRLLARPLALLAVAGVALAEGPATPYDYRARPVKATDPESIQGVPMVVDGVGGGSPFPIAPYTYLHKPGINFIERKGHPDWGGAGWNDPWTNDCSEPAAPTPERPARLKLEYPEPVAAARFALYFPRQGNMDGYLPITAHAAAPRTLLLFRSEDGERWAPILHADPLPWTSPQVIDVPDPRPARFYLFYGAPFTLPALWQRKVLAGDPVADRRVLEYARFLAEGPARVREGPMRGGYYSQVGGARGATRGSDQAGNPWMVSHATGAVLWALLHHRDLLGAPEPALDQAARESADHLVRIQEPAGGWSYARIEADGYVPSGRHASAGTIWNVWALHRAGERLGEPRYLEAAARARRWWVERFLSRHTYTGYWEDANAGGVIYPTREGYEGSMAVLAFLEMGERELALEAARGLATWVHTRTPSYRTYDTGYGNMCEQLTWPANFYIVPQTGFALGRILDATGDPFWEPFAAIPKGLGWWVERGSGAAFFPNEASGHIPIHNVPLYKNYWVDWNGAQQASRVLWWLIEAIGRRSAGLVDVDPYLLAGTVDGEASRPFLPDGAVAVETEGENQLNWLGFRSSGRVALAILNDLEEEAVEARVEVLPAFSGGAPPARCRRALGGRVEDVDLQPAGGALRIRALPGSVTLLEWPVR